MVLRARLMPEAEQANGHDDDEPEVEDDDDFIELVDERAAPKHQILDYPGFEGTPLSIEKAMKLMFARPGSKEASRMLRVQNRLKLRTTAPNAPTARNRGRPATRPQRGT